MSSLAPTPVMPKVVNAAATACRRCSGSLGSENRKPSTKSLADVAYGVN